MDGSASKQLHHLGWIDARNLTPDQSEAARQHAAWAELQTILSIDPRRFWIHPQDWGIDAAADPPAFHGGLIRRQGERAVCVHRF